MKIIRIDGFRGIITAIFCVVCTFAGFIVFPGKVICHFWNLYLVNLYMFPTISLFQGILLWLMIGITYMIITSKKGLALSFKEVPFNDAALGKMPMLSEDELENIIKKAKTNAKIIRNSRMLPPVNPFDSIGANGEEKNTLNQNNTDMKEVNDNNISK